MQIKILKTEKW